MPATITHPYRLTLQQAVAAGFGGYSTLRKKIALRELPAERVGRRLLVRLEDLEAMPTPVVGRPTETASVDTAIDRLVASAPRLTIAQRERLALLLGGA